jgi:hypothetical protein
LGSKYIARVGIFGGGGDHKQVVTKVRKSGKAVRVVTSVSSGMTNADIMVVHEFGSETNNIPPRSALRMPLEYKKRDLVKFLGSDRVKTEIEAGNIRKVYKMMGVFGEGVVDEAFATRGYGMWADNAEETKKRKGSDMPLVDSGQLARAVTSDVVTKQ